MIGQQPDGVQAEIGENLRADSDFMLRRRLRHIAVVADDPAVLGAQSQPCLMQVNEHARALLDDALAASRAPSPGNRIATDPSQIAVGAMGMHADQHVLLAGDIAVDQSQVGFGADLARIENGAELAELGGDAAFGLAVNIVFVAADDSG